MRKFSSVSIYAGGARFYLTSFVHGLTEANNDPPSMWKNLWATWAT